MDLAEQRLGQGPEPGVDGHGSGHPRLLEERGRRAGAGLTPDPFDWFRNFLQFLIDTESHVWFGKLIAIGETAVGVALILGAFVGIAAFFGATMNFSFLLAGTTSTNPVLFLFAVLLILAWKTAGYIGLDRFLLPLLGTPWQPIPLRRATAVEDGSPAPG